MIIKMFTPTPSNKTIKNPKKYIYIFALGGGAKVWESKPFFPCLLTSKTMLVDFSILGGSLSSSL